MSSIEELRKLLDAEKLVDGLAIPMESEWRAELIAKIREHDQALLGATYHECVECKCCWLEKPGDAAAKRCSCCLVSEGARTQLVAIDGILDKASCKLNPLRFTVLDGVRKLAEEFEACKRDLLKARMGQS